MAQVELIMPKMGESIMEATILKWLKQEGERIEADESILEIATDKVDSEVPSPEAGVLSKILFQEGDTIEVGKAIAIIATGAEDVPASNAGQSPENEAPTKESTTSTTTQREPAISESSPPASQTAIAPVVNKQENGNGGLSRSDLKRFYSPLVLNMAKGEGILADELETIPGTGSNGRVTKKDMIAYLASRVGSPIPNPTATKSSQSTSSNSDKISSPAFAFSGTGNTEIIQMDRMRKLIADHMVMSKKTSPHVTSFVEADVTNLVNWRNQVKDAFQKKEGQKITFTPLFVDAVVRAIKDFPLVNSSVDGDKIIVKRDINIGIAAALPSGNLIVPVIKNADHLNLIGVTKTVNGLVQRARENKLKPEEIQDGTFTLTNVGTFGNLSGTPIINQPQVAILATGAIIKKPAVLETEMGDVIAIRHMMMMSLSYDHRSVDGFLGGSFLRRVADYLEQWDANTSI